MILRTSKTFANYRAKAVQLAKRYDVKEKEYISAELKQKLISLQMEAVKSGANETDVKTNPEKYLELLNVTNEYSESSAIAKEMFLIENDFKEARELCEIWFEVFDFDNFLEETPDYEELIGFLFNTFNAFFLKQRRLTGIASYGQKSSPIEMNPSPI